MATVKKPTAAERRKQDAEDAKRGQARFFDQPGQWVDTTPKSVRKKQQAAWKEYEKKYMKKK